MRDQGGRRLLGVELELLGERDADPGRVDQLEELGLIFEVRAGGIAERIAAAAVVLLEKLLRVRRILAVDAPLSAQVADFVGRLRSLPFVASFQRVPGIAESVEWAKALVALSLCRLLQMASRGCRP